MSIKISDITNPINTGIFDELMAVVNKHIEDQYLNNRITGSDYANVYLGSMQAVLSQSVQFALQEKLTEAQIDGVLADNLLKSKQLEVAEQERLAKAYEVSTLLPDQHTTNVKQQLLLDTQEQTEQYKTDFILPAELLQLQKQTDVTERQMLEAEATGTKQRALLDTEEQIKQYEYDFLLPEQLTKVQEEIDLLQTQDSEMALNGAKQRELQDEQVLKVKEEIDLLKTQDSEMVLDGIKNRELKDEQIRNTYTDRVVKDKTAAKLGLDNVMKQSEESRNTNPSFVYNPRYEDGV